MIGIICLLLGVVLIVDGAPGTMRLIFQARVARFARRFIQRPGLPPSGSS